MFLISLPGLDIYRLLDQNNTTNKFLHIILWSTISRNVYFERSPFNCKSQKLSIFNHTIGSFKVDEKYRQVLQLNKGFRVLMNFFLQSERPRDETRAYPETTHNFWQSGSTIILYTASQVRCRDIICNLSRTTVVEQQRSTLICIVFTVYTANMHD